MRTFVLFRLLLIAGLLSLLLLSASGCLVGRFFTRSVGAMFAPVRAVPNKITRPFRPDARIAVLWVGHATALVQMDDKFILTDPVFTSSVGQLSPRQVEPGIDVENLPPIDAVLISHMHFDHFSLGSLELIESRVRWLGLPEGGLTYLTNFAFEARELRTWDSHEVGGVRVTAVPVEHTGWRYGIDAAWMDTSFTGYVVEYRDLKVYFGGDTAFVAEKFAATKERFPGMHVALLPIAPIRPREFMRSRHVDPAQALDAFQLLGAKQMVPIHYGTFINSTDDPEDARRELIAEMKRRNLTTDQIAILSIGEQRILIPK